MKNAKVSAGHYHCKDGDGKDDGNDETAEDGPYAGTLVELRHQLSQRLQHELLLGKENEQKDAKKEQRYGHKSHQR